MAYGIGNGFGDLGGYGSDLGGYGNGYGNGGFGGYGNGGFGNDFGSDNGFIGDGGLGTGGNAGDGNIGTDLGQQNGFLQNALGQSNANSAQQNQITKLEGEYSRAIQRLGLQAKTNKMAADALSQADKNSTAIADKATQNSA